MEAKSMTLVEYYFVWYAYALKKKKKKKKKKIHHVNCAHVYIQKGHLVIKLWIAYSIGSLIPGLENE
jgi:hypothetical protein